MRLNPPLIIIKRAWISLWSESSALESASDQNQMRLNPSLIKIKCAWIRLWSESSALESAYDQNQMRLNPSIKIKRASIRLWSESSALESASDQNQMRLNPSLIKTKCAWIRLWSDFHICSWRFTHHQFGAQETSVRTIQSDQKLVWSATFQSLVTYGNAVLIQNSKPKIVTE